MELNQRSLGILQELRKSNDYIKLEIFAEKYRVSIRAIRYDIEKISELLSKNGFPKLEKNHLRGVKLKHTIELDDWLNRFIAKDIDMTYFFSKEERQMIIISKLLEAQNPVTIAYFQDYFGLSKNTVLKELDALENWVSKRNLEMVRKPRIGIYIKGSELLKRNAIIELMTETIGTDELFNYFSKKIALNRTDHIKFDSIFSEIDIDYINLIVQESELNLNRKFTDEAYSNLLTHISLMVKRVQLNKKINLPKINEENICGTKEYEESAKIVEKLNRKYKLSIPTDEIKFIAIHLLGAQVMESEDSYEQTLSIAVDKMIVEIETVYDISFGDKKAELRKNLITHLRPAIYRMSLGLMIKNPLHEKIIREFEELYQNIKLAAKVLEEYIGFEVEEHEITNLTLHFGAFIENKAISKKKSPKIVLVCASGIGTAAMLAMQIQQKYECEIVAKISARAIEDIKDIEYNHIISTVDIQNLGIEDYIKINPLLLKKDELLLNKYLYPKNSVIKTDIELVVKDLVEITKKYAEVKDEHQLAYEFLYALKRNRKKITGKKELNITDVIKKETIKINANAQTFEQALYMGTDLLVKQGCIHEDYYQDILESIKEMGAYMAIGPGIYLSHARPNPHIYHTSMSILTLKHPLLSGNDEFDPIKLIITLAAEDNDGHLKILSQLTNILLDPNDLEKITNSKNKEEVLETIKKQNL